MAHETLFETTALHDLLQALAVHAPAPGETVAVAYSGGADSSALLWASAQLWPGRVWALHVNHGLQAAATQFEAHCQTRCEQAGLPLRVARLQVQVKNRQSTEEAARQARYRALAEMALAVKASVVLLAQHADDQLESLLLALSRGAGLPGLAAMAPGFERFGMRFARPCLALSRTSLRQVLLQLGENPMSHSGYHLASPHLVPHWQALAPLANFIEDPSNADTRFTRNRMRDELLPALLRCFPQARATLARSAAHAAQAQTLLQELAEQDLAQLAQPEQAPRIDALQALSWARQANVLRHWLKSRHHTQASAAQLAELQKQIAACRSAAQHIEIKVGAGFVRRTPDAQGRPRGEGIDWYNA